ncbi:MAG: hypothetical protein AAFS10_09380 [Myxococcota bacterium]
MKSNILWTILEHELNAEQHDGRWALPSGTRITVFLQGPNNMFPVSKVVGVVSREHYLVLESDDGRVFTSLEEVVAVRADEEASHRESRLGFS